jgi:hypothetical protein
VSFMGWARGAASGSAYPRSSSLDASTAGDFAKALRIGTDIAQLVTIAVLYQVRGDHVHAAHTTLAELQFLLLRRCIQAGDHIVRMFDKVTVLYAGHQVFFGTIDQALGYFHELGFQRRFGQSVGDFLVAVTDPASRHIREGYESVAPLTALDMEAAWKRSDICKQLERETTEYLRYLADRHLEGADEFRRLTAIERAKHQRQQSRYTITFSQQVRLAMKRRYRIVMVSHPECCGMRLEGDLFMTGTRFFFLSPSPGRLGQPSRALDFQHVLRLDHRFRLLQLATGNLQFILSKRRTLLRTLTQRPIGHDGGLARLRRPSDSDPTSPLWHDQT